MSCANYRWLTLRLGLILSLLAVCAGSNRPLAAEPSNAIHVTGQITQSSDWTAARLETQLAADIQTVKYTSKGQPHSAKCVPLLALLKAAGAPVELKMDPKAPPAKKNMPVRLVVMVTGRDGYVAAFSLAELLPDGAFTDAWLALEVDGKALSDLDGPVRMIVPGDAKPARWVRGVETISIVDGTAAATTQPK